MPQFNDMPDAKGVVTKIAVGVGDIVEHGAVVLSVELDKAVVDVEAPQRGRVIKILVGAGSEVTPGQDLIELE